VQSVLRRLDSARSSVRKSLCYKDASAKRAQNLSYVGDQDLSVSWIFREGHDFWMLGKTFVSAAFGARL